MPISVYAFINNKDILFKSSSGGAFTAIAKTFFDLNPACSHIVYGACFDKDFNVVHDAAYTLADCEKFRGSKYVRSTSAPVYEKIEKNLLANKYVLFSGTPCQVAALKKSLKNKNIDTAKLYTIDLICHGSPKPQIWTNYKNWLEKKYKSKICYVNFRHKDENNKSYCLKIKLKNGQVLINTLETSIFRRLFFRGFAFPDGCYKCPFANLNRLGDITLGDFWGIENIFPAFPAKNGVSEILVNSEKGNILLTNLKNSLTEDALLKQCFSDDYIKYQNNLQKPANKPPNYKQFVEDYNKRGFEYVIKKYVGYNISGKIKYILRKFITKLKGVH